MRGAALPAAPTTDAAAGTSVGAAAATGASPGTVQPDAKETREKQQAVSLIMLNVKRQHYVMVRQAGTARAAWKALAEEFRSSDRARVMNLRTEVNTIAMGPKETAVEFFNSGRALVWELNMLEMVILDEHLLSALLTGLDQKSAYKEIFANMDDLSLDKALVKLRAAETRMAAEKQRRPVKTALAATAEHATGSWKAGNTGDVRWTERRKCFQCNKVGHIRADCPDEDAGEQDRRGVAMFATTGFALHGSKCGLWGVAPHDGCDGGADAAGAVQAGQHQDGQWQGAHRDKGRHGRFRCPRRQGHCARHAGGHACGAGAGSVAAVSADGGRPWI
eukprot:TRINITY_DN6567_c0_g1_i2.p1 TRINITY_DN6567_c0_g1~~TRINITY_DN6567_c0_g1_i2.p1  ORF type:complete len:334 (-),score=69.86 TRINITY_DN6567_c0_g1_i2:479-1480(-)